MTQQQAFCAQCGQPLQPGVSFCRSCGAPVGQVTAEASPPTGFYPSAGVPSGPLTATAQPQQRRRPNVLLILAGIALILVGLIQPAALLFGSETTAKVVAAEQIIDGTSERMDYNYRITYAFTVEGKQYTGNYQINKVYNIANLPGEGKVLAIKYLAIMPNINARTNQDNPFLVLLLAGGIGVLLIVLGIKGKTVMRT